MGRVAAFAPLIVAFIFAACGADDEPNFTEAEIEFARRSIIRQQRVIFDTVTVENLSHTVWTLNSPSGERPTVHLDFRVVSGQDIEVLLLDDVQYANWSASLRFSSVYESGRLAADRTEIRVAPLTEYKLVLNNRYSWFTPKQVSVNVSLTANL